MDTTATRLDAKLLYRRLDSLFGEVEGPRPRRKVMEYVPGGFLPDARRRPALVGDATVVVLRRRP